MSTDKGYIKVYRDIRDHWIWKDKPFDKARAWIDLIMLANHNDNTIMFDGRPMKIKRGQYMTSLSILANRWGWSRGTVKRYIDDLVRDNMLNKKRHAHGTLLTIEKYSDYQDARNSKRNSHDTSDSTSRSTSHGHKQGIKEGIRESTIEEYREINGTIYYPLEEGDEYDDEGWGEP